MSARVSIIGLALVACAQPGAGDAGADEAGAPAASLAVRSGALEGDGPTTIPYGGYVDFDGEPVNASGVKFNFAIFPCATPGTGAGQCAPLWVAVGDWGTAADWKLAWPANASVTLPIFSGRFTVELGGAGQTTLPDTVFAGEHGTLYLGIQIEGRAMGTLQKLAPAFKSIMASQGDRLRVRSALDVDDPTGGAAQVSADDGLVVTHSEPTQDRLLRVGAGAAPPLVVDGSGATVTGLTAAAITADDVEVRGALTGPGGHIAIDGVAAPLDVMTTMSAGLVYDSNANLSGYLYGDANSGYAWVDGRPVLRLTGGYVGIQDDARAAMRPAPQKGWSFMMWFKSTTSTGHRTLTSNYACSVNVVSLAINTEQKLSYTFRAGVDTGYYLTTTNPIDAGWHHVVATRDDAGAIHLYVDGTSVGSTPANLNSHWDTNHPWYFGTETPCNTGPSNLFHGYMDAIRVYQRALTADEIAKYYAATKPLHP
ncbi:MAG: LamG domain-containing protein [Deltaproteobacteria bacterium]|nr:LamG domain-containing protein [Deltaproteobacteria bacterium]